MNGGIMNAMQALKTVAKNEGIPLAHIGRKMGLADNYVNKTINRNSVPRVDTMAKMLDVCGYALCAIPKESIPDDAIVID